jgi:hypothetical protein
LPVAAHDANAPVPAFLAKAPDANELRAREREMHLAQMREEARQREEAAAREARREEPAREEPAGVEQPAAPAPQPAPVRVDAREILESAGLQMVETRPDRVPAAMPEPEAVPLGRPRRERPGPATEEPLVQVETKQ